MILLDGKTTAAVIRKEIADEIQSATKHNIRAPGLAVILVGDDPASQIYVRNKQKACNEAGIKSFPYILPSVTTQEKLLKTINELNHNPEVDGILLQLPLPNGLIADKCILAIDPNKDVDGFHPQNIGKLCIGLPGFLPCTPAGMLEILKRYNFSLAGKKAVIVGRSNIVGKPLAQLLIRKENNATVTICHTGTRNLKEECLSADFLFLAMGQPGAIKQDMVKDGCIVVDAGINRTKDGLFGDADFENVCKKVKAITPVPGGVGPMTIAMLLVNTMQSWRNNLLKQYGTLPWKNYS